MYRICILLLKLRQTYLDLIIGAKGSAISLSLSLPEDVIRSP